MRKIKITLLGHGLFMDTIRDAIKKNFTIIKKNPDLYLVANYGRKISKQELDKNTYINVHPSLLPKLKGATPIQTAILQGDKITGFTIITMDEHIDHGKIISAGKINIAQGDDYDTLAKKIALVSANNLIKIIPKFINNEIKLRSQDELKTSWTKKISDQDRLISSSELKKNPHQACARVRALYPKPKAYLMLNNKRLLIHKAKIENARFVPLFVQIEGKKIMPWQDFIRGWHGKNIFD